MNLSRMDLNDRISKNLYTDAQCNFDIFLQSSAHVQI